MEVHLIQRSFAVVVWEILTRLDPYPEVTDLEAAKQISEGLHLTPPQNDSFGLIVNVIMIKVHVIVRNAFILSQICDLDSNTL